MEMLIVLSKFVYRQREMKERTLQSLFLFHPLGKKWRRAIGNAQPIVINEMPQQMKKKRNETRETRPVGIKTALKYMSFLKL